MCTGGAREEREDDIRVQVCMRSTVAEAIRLLCSRAAGPFEVIGVQTFAEDRDVTFAEDRWVFGF